MKKIAVTATILFACVSFANAQDKGEKLFKTVCVACHTIGKGKLVGPDLKGMTNRYDEKWLTSWIKSSQTMVKKGDPKAVKAFNAGGKIPMPDNNFSDADIKSIIAYVKKIK